MRTFQLELDTAKSPIFLDEYGFLQGNKDVTLTIRLAERGAPVTIADSAKPKLFFNYQNGSQPLAIDETTLDYPVTIANNVITITANKYFSRGYGRVDLQILVDEKYTYSMYYNVDKNVNFDPPPVAHGDDALYARADLSNVDNYSSIPDGTIMVKRANKLEASALSETDTKIISTKTLQVPPNTIEFGLNTALHENGSFLEYSTNTLNKNYILCDYENDPLLGSKKPIYWKRAEKEIKYLLQPIATTLMSNVTQVNLGYPTSDAQVQGVYLNFANPVTNFKIMVNVNGTDIADHPTGSWDGTNAGYNIQSGEQFIAYAPYFSALTEYNIIVRVKADSAINLMGDGIKPYIAYDMNRITRLDMALMEDVTCGDVSEVEYINTESPQAIPTNKKRVYYRLDKSLSIGQTIVQTLPDSAIVLGMQLNIEFFAPHGNTMQINSSGGQQLFLLDGGSKTTLYASNTGWVRYDIASLEFTENAITNNMRIKIDCDVDGTNPKIIVTNEVI